MIKAGAALQIQCLLLLPPTIWIWDCMDCEARQVFSLGYNFAHFFSLQAINKNSDKGWWHSKVFVE